MLETIVIELPAASYHTSAVAQARETAVAAVDAVNDRIAEFQSTTAALLAADVSSIGPASVFNGDVRTLQFQILQDELKARRLADTFFTLHRRNSQDVINAANGQTSERLTEANRHAHSENWMDNRRRIGTVSDQLQAVVKRHLTI